MNFGAALVGLFISAAVGFISSIILSLLTYGVAHLWRWVDDFESPSSVNWWTRLTLAVLGRRWDGHYYVGGRSSLDEGDGILVSSLFWAFASVVGFLSYLQAWVPAVLVPTVALVFVCRYVRRLNKKLEAHTSDANAHGSRQ